MGAALHSSFAACLAPNELADDTVDSTNKGMINDEVHPVISPDKKSVKMEQKKNEEQKVRVQGAEEIHYGSAGTVPKGATGVVLGKFEGTGSPFIFINWDAFPELGRVSVQPEKLLPMHDDRPGTYVITREAGVTQTAALAKEVVGILPVGTTINIVEVVYLKEDHRWRGRLEEPFKGWISILASNNGARWAEQPSAGGSSAPTQQPAHSATPQVQPATSGSFQVDVGDTRGRSQSRAGGSNHVVTSTERSLSAQRAATAVYGNYAGSIAGSRPGSQAGNYAGSIAGSRPGSQAGSFRVPLQVQPQTVVSRANSFQYTVNGETYGATSSNVGSFQFPVNSQASSVQYTPVGTAAGQASGLKYARVLERPASFSVGEQRSLLAVPHAPRKLSMDEVSSRVASTSLPQNSARSSQPLNSGSAAVRISSVSSEQDKKKTSPEVLAVLQGIKSQLKGMADRYSDTADNKVQGCASSGSIRAGSGQAVLSTEAGATKGALPEEEPKKWMGA